MRLGFWNRLALVVGVIGTFVAATAITLVSMSDFNELISTHYADCVSRADMDAAMRETCWNEYLAAQLRGPGWGFWRETIIGSAMAAVILYLLIAASVWVARWVWRGRQIGH